MSRLDAYATVQEYRANKAKLSGDDDGSLASELLATSRFIDDATGHREGFGVDEANVIRYYQSFGAYVLDIGDLVSVSLVEELLGTTWTTVAASAYNLKPYNASREGWPYRQIERTSVIWPPRQIPNGPRVRITGKWGWPAVPDAIKSACIELTAILRIESGRATGRVDEAGQVLNVSRAARDIVGQLLASYGNPAVYV